MKRVVTFVLLLVCIAGSVFAADDTSDKTLTVKVNRVAVSAIAFTKEEIVDGTTSFGDKVYSDDIVLDAQEKLSNDKYEDDTVWASAISNDDKNPIKLYLKFTPLTKGEGNNVEYIPLTITAADDSGKTDTAVNADGAVIDFSETEEGGRGMRAISHQLKISMSKSDYENASTGEYSSTLTLTVSKD